MQTEEDVVPIPAITFLMGFIKDKIMCINKNKELLPYYEKARDTLEYNPETGKFYKWIKSIKKYKETGRVTTDGYLQVGVTINGVRRHLGSHRLAWYMYFGLLPVYTIDHVNRNPLDNRIINLREALMVEQSFNKKTINKEGFRGIYKSGNGWCARIRENGVNNYLGIFKSPKEASKAYDDRAKEIHGEFYAEKS